MAKILTVFGATGQQGGALIQHVLRHSQLSELYKVRGVTRDASRQISQALADQGVEMVEADLDDFASLKAATEGSYAVFAVTNYWEKASAAIEISQGKAIADAAVKAGVSLIIWSSLPRTGVAHFNSKADVEDYIRTLPIKSAFYMPGWFMQNFVHIMKPKKAYNGTYVMGKPWPTATSSSLVPLVDIEDTGKYIESFLEDPEKHNHVKLMAATGFYTPNEICETWSKVTGRNVVFDEEHDAVSGSTMTKEQREALTTSNVASESTYYGPGGEEGLEWTLTQMKEPPATWKSFVERHEPWFVDT